MSEPATRPGRPYPHQHLVRAVTLMELLLVVAVLAVLAPIVVPPMTSYVATRNDEPATRQIIDLISHTRTLGLLGRRDEAIISFTNNSPTISVGGVAHTLPAGYRVANFRIVTTPTTNLSVAFAISGNISCNGSAAESASVELQRGGVTIRTINLLGVGIPEPVLTASVDPANPSPSVSGRCRWF